MGEIIATNATFAGGYHEHFTSRLSGFSMEEIASAHGNLRTRSYTVRPLAHHTTGRVARVGSPPESCPFVGSSTRRLPARVATGAPAFGPMTEFWCATDQLSLRSIISGRCRPDGSGWQDSRNPKSPTEETGYRPTGAGRDRLWELPAPPSRVGSLRYQGIGTGEPPARFRRRHCQRSRGERRPDRGPGGTHYGSAPRVCTCRYWPRIEAGDVG